MAASRGGIPIVLALAAAVLAAMVACEAVPMTAPAGTTIFLQANPGFVEANGGRSLVTAFLTEPAGTLVPDGTVVFFFTDLGAIEEQVKTVDGLAKTYFVSDSRSGNAKVVAYSGGGAPTTPTTTLASASLSASTGGSGTQTVTIIVGSANPANVVVTANPARIGAGGSAAITANVFDGDGNPVRNVPVIFSITAIAPATALPQETLDSGGVPQFTDSSGRAFDTLRTRAVTARVVTVTATTPKVDADGTVNVAIN